MINRHIRTLAFSVILGIFLLGPLYGADYQDITDYDQLVDLRNQVESRIEALRHKRNNKLRGYLDSTKANIDVRHRDNYVQRAIDYMPGSYQKDLNDLYRRKNSLNSRIGTLENQRYQDYVRRFEAGEILEQRLVVQRDQRLAEAARIKDPAARARETKRIIDDYSVRSRKLTHQYRQPFVDRLITDVNAGLPANQHITASAGTPLYITDSSGKRILNPQHRGWSGDLDFSGSQAASDRLNRRLQDLGIGTEDYAGYLDSRRLEVTVNKSGFTDTPGSASHSTRVRVDALSKETYVSCGMNSAQPGRANVEVNDHYKKAISGLNESPEMLLQRKSRLQGMSKGTLKATASASLTDGELKSILGRAGLNRTPDEFRRQLEIIKSSPHMAESVLTREELARFQNACRETLDYSVQKTGNQAQADLRSTRENINRLEAEAAAARNRQNLSRADELTRQAQQLRYQEVDSRTRIEATNRAREEIMSGQPEARRSRERIIHDESGQPGRTGKRPGTRAAARGVRTYMHFLNLRSWAEDLYRGVGQAVEEESEGDSALKTWGKATYYTIVESTGIPAISEIYREDMEEARRHIEKAVESLDEHPLILLNPDNEELIRKSLIGQIERRYYTRAVAQSTWTLGSGMAQGVISAPSQTGTTLGELYSKEGLQISEDSRVQMDNKLIRYNSAKMRRFQELMKELRDRGYDEELAIERDSLIDYFYGFRERHRVNEDLVELSDRWIAAVRHEVEKSLAAPEKELEPEAETTEITAIASVQDTAPDTVAEPDKPAEPARDPDPIVPAEPAEPAEPEPVRHPAPAVPVEPSEPEPARDPDPVVPAEPAEPTTPTPRPSAPATPVTPTPRPSVPATPVTPTPKPSVPATPVTPDRVPDQPQEAEDKATEKWKPIELDKCLVYHVFLGPPEEAFEPYSRSEVKADLLWTGYSFSGSTVPPDRLLKNGYRCGRQYPPPRGHSSWNTALVQVSVAGHTFWMQNTPARSDTIAGGAKYVFGHAANLVEMLTAENIGKSWDFRDACGHKFTWSEFSNFEFIKVTRNYHAGAEKTSPQTIYEGPISGTSISIAGRAISPVLPSDTAKSRAEKEGRKIWAKMVDEIISELSTTEQDADVADSIKPFLLDLDLDYHMFTKLNPQQLKQYKETRKRRIATEIFYPGLVKGFMRAAWSEQTEGRMLRLHQQGHITDKQLADYRQKNPLIQQALSKLSELQPILAERRRKLTGDISVFQYSINNISSELKPVFDEVNRLKRLRQSMGDSEFLKHHRAEYERVRQQWANSESKRQDLTRMRGERDKLREDLKALDALGLALDAEYRKGNYLRCIEIANQSALARQLGYVPLDIGGRR